MSVASTGNARRAYTEEQWNEVKPLFVKLYRDDKNTLKYTMDQLRQVHGFKATEKMYKTHIKRWGLEKYNKDDELLHLIRLDREQGPAKNRSYTINGRPTTVEDAKKHFRRKKVKSLDDLIANLSSQLPDTIDIVYEDDEEEVEEVQQYDDFSTALPIQNYQGMAMPQLVLNTGYTPIGEADVMDVNMDDRVTLSPDDFDVDMNFGFPAFQGIETTDQDQQQNYFPGNAGTVAVYRQHKPSLVAIPYLDFTTSSFLHNMSDFSNMIVDAILAEPVEYRQLRQLRRFNKLWDLFCTTSTHRRQDRMQLAWKAHDESRVTFLRMLQVRDPWLLLSLCLVLNDNLSRENNMDATTFLNDMSMWTNKLSSDHPIIRLVRDLQETSHRDSNWASYLLEATVRMISEQLNKTVGVHHDLALEVSRLHARTMNTIGMHGSAETLLAHDLATVEREFGSRSLQNFSRLSSLARTHYVAKHYDKALALYQKIDMESNELADESSLTDIKYGAMYFIAKIHAAMFNHEQAMVAAQRALRFALEKQGPEHYWATGSRDLINQLNNVEPRLIEIG